MPSFAPLDQNTTQIPQNRYVVKVSEYIYTDYTITENYTWIS